MNDELDAFVMEQLAKNGVKIVAMRCAGYNNVNLKAACEHGILARLMTFPNVIVSSHQAFFTAEAERNIAETTMKSFDDFANGRKLQDAIYLNCGGQKNCPGKRPGETCARASSALP